MVDEGLSRTAAARKAEISDNWLYQQLRRPEVLRYRRARMEVIRTSEAARSIAKIALLMDTAESEHVQCEAAKWLASLEGIIPGQRSESNGHPSVSVGPGLMTVFSAPAERQSPVIDGSTRVASPRLDRLPGPVPHPVLAEEEQDSNAK